MIDLMTDCQTDSKYVWQTGLNIKLQHQIPVLKYVPKWTLVTSRIGNCIKIDSNYLLSSTTMWFIYLLTYVNDTYIPKKKSMKFQNTNLKS